MTGLYSFPGQAIKKSGLPAGRKVVNAGKTCSGVAVRGACLPYTLPVACIRTVGTTAGSIATYGLEAACNAVPEMLLMGEGKVLADLSEEDLKEAYRQVGLDFQVPNWMRLELRNQDLRKIAEHDSACRIQKWYRGQKRRKQYDQNVAAKELRQQGSYLQAYHLQKVRNAEEHGRQQQQLLTATQQSCDQLEQQVQQQAQQIQEQRQRAAEESEVTSAQQAQQAAELAAAKREFATCLAAHQDFQREAKDKLDQLQEQLTQRGVHMHAAEDQLANLHKEFVGKCNEVTKGKQEQAALQSSHHATLKAVEDTSAQLQQQLAQKGTDLSSAEHKVTCLQQLLSITDQSKHAATQERSVQLQLQLLQKQLDRKVTELGGLQNQLPGLHAELGIMTKAKEDGLEDIKSLKSQLTAALADRNDALQELTERRNRAAQVQGRGQALAVRLAASQSHRSSGPSSPSTPPDERPKGRSSVSTQLGPMPAPTSQASLDQGTSWSDDDGDEASAAPPGFGRIPSAKSTSQTSSDQGSASFGGVGVFYAPEVPDMPPGFANPGGVGALNAPADPDVPPGFGHCGGVGTPDTPGAADLPPGFGNPGGVGVLNVPGDPDMPPGFGHCGGVGTPNTSGEADLPPCFGNPGGVGVPNAPGEPDMPPGFGRSLPASTGKSKGPKRMPNLAEALGDKLPLVKHMVPKLVGLAKQLGKLHKAGLVHQAVHQHFVLVGQEGKWHFAELEKAAPNDSSLDKSEVYDGTEAPEIAEQQHKAGFYYPQPQQDMWAFGLLLFFVFKGKGQLPLEHEKAIQEGTSLLFAKKLYKSGKYTEWKEQIECTLRLQGKLNPASVSIVLGCLSQDPGQRLTAAKVVADVTEVIHKVGW